MAGYIGSKASVVSSGAERKKAFAITTNTTSLTGLSYTVNQVHVFHNGVRLVDGTDYTATDGTSITLTSAAENGDEVVVISYASFQTSDTVSASAGGTFSNAVTIDADGATALTVDRATSDGTIIDVQKGGTTVGSIGAYANEYYHGSAVGGDTFLRHGWSGIVPATSSGTNRDAAIQLGSSVNRFKDLYLSGGVYLGGTGAANKLDDYEEGTWTPSLLGSSVSGTTTYVQRSGWYRKIGDVVICHCLIFNTAHTGSGLAEISGLPFSCNEETVGEAQINQHSAAFPSSNGGLCNLSSVIQNGDTKIHMRGTYSDTTSGPYYVQMQNFRYVRITITYKTS